MSENPISISSLNDFIFCPVSIYFHAVDGENEKLLYQDSCQLNGTEAHKNSDAGRYSDLRSMLQGIPVYCEKLDLCGKIDTFDISRGILTERKKKIKTIYDGYIFQLYGQYYALSEMGYTVKEIRLYSMDDNRVYRIDKPEDNHEMNNKFLSLVDEMKKFSFSEFKQSNLLKCKNCIYEPICGYSSI